jgi:hypothetical protein
MSDLSFPSFAVEASDALQSSRSLSPPRDFVESWAFQRILAMRDTPRAAVVRRGKRLVRKGLLVVDPEAVANLMLDEAA